MARMSTSEINQIITDRVTEALQKEIVPWKKGWTTVGGGFPISLSTGKYYQGVNVWLLSITSMTNGYASPYWGTYNQIAKLSGMIWDEKTKRLISPDGTKRGVRRGEKHTKVVWFKPVTKPDRDDPDKTVSYWTGGVDMVFNASQADQLPEQYYAKPPVDRVFVPHDEAQRIIDEYVKRDGPTLVNAYQDQAFYRPGADTITLPMPEQFDTPDEYYSTAFHEATHSTGHKSRNNRPAMQAFDHYGSDRYGREELVAEMGAAILNAYSGIDTTFDNSAAYIAGWLRNIKKDVKLVPEAAREAQKAVNFILDIHPESEENENAV